MMINLSSSGIGLTHAGHPNHVFQNSGLFNLSAKNNQKRKRTDLTRGN